jgi:hypothetical protein
MKKAFLGFGIVAAALLMLGSPVRAQTPGDITATQSASPTAPAAGQTVIVTTQFSIPALSATAAAVSVTSSVGPLALVSFTPGLSSCLTTTTTVTCTWSTPDPASPQTLVVSVPVTAAGTVNFTANAGAATTGATLTQKASTAVTVGQATTTTAAGTTTTTAATTTVAPPPTEAPTTTVAPTTTAAGTLPATGSNSSAPLVIALFAIGAGVLLVGAARLVRARS